MVELVDTSDLKSDAQCVPVRLRVAAPNKKKVVYNILKVWYNTRKCYTPFDFR